MHDKEFRVLFYKGKIAAPKNSSNKRPLPNNFHQKKRKTIFGRESKGGYILERSRNIFCRLYEKKKLIQGLLRIAIKLFRIARTTTYQLISLKLRSRNQCSQGFNWSHILLLPRSDPLARLPVTNMKKWLMGKRFHSKIDILEKECTFCGNGPIPLLWREQQTGAALDKLHEARRSTRFEIKNYLSRKIRYIAFLN